MLWLSHSCDTSDCQMSISIQNSISHTWRGCMLLQQQILFIDKVHIFKYLIYISCSLLDQCHLLGFCLMFDYFDFCYSITITAWLLNMCNATVHPRHHLVSPLSFIKCWAPPIIFNLHFVDIVSSFITCLVAYLSTFFHWHSAFFRFIQKDR